MATESLDTHLLDPMGGNTLAIVLFIHKFSRVPKVKRRIIHNTNLKTLLASKDEYNLWMVRPTPIHASIYEVTSTRFKSIVRVIKRLRNEMDEAGIIATSPIPSYLIECVVYNAPNNRFGHYQYKDDVRSVITYLYNQTLNDEDCREWREVNYLKYLFGAHQAWTRQQVNDFVLAAWRYAGFE